MPLPAYVVITPARNEVQFIELTIRSMIAQTVRPLRWVIVSDGSTDGTDELVRRYAVEHSWIELLRTPERRERHFAGKATAFNAGYARVEGLPYEVIASLDADLSFDAGYFAYLLARLAEDSGLGLVGTPFRDSVSNETYDYRFVSIEHVSGACQVFRRQCWEQIGGYVPMKGGGIDSLAVLAARMRGWKTRTFTEKITHHHRPMGTAQKDGLSVWFRSGAKDYAFGNHPVWELLRTTYQMSKRPFVLGGLALLLGYLSAWMRGVQRTVSPEMMSFHRRDQMRRLRQIVSSAL